MFKRFSLIAAAAALIFSPACVNAQGQPAQWRYTLPAGGTSTATYPGNVVVNGAITNITGIKCDGVTDDTAAINSAISAGAGKTLLLPAGTCLYRGGGTLGAGTVLRGQGPQTTFIRFTTAALPSDYGLIVSGLGAQVRDIGFNSSVTQTADTYVLLSGQNNVIDNFYMEGDFRGIYMIGVVNKITNGRFGNGATGATRITASGGDTSNTIQNVAMGAQSPQVVTNGIEVVNAVALTINNVHVLQQGRGLFVHSDAASGATTGPVISLTVTDSFFDSSTNENIYLITSNAGALARLQFTNVWAGSGAATGFRIVQAGAGSISGVGITDSVIGVNAGTGLSTAGTINDLRIKGGCIAQNGSNGAFLSGTLTNSSIIGVKIGSGCGLTGNVGVGLALDTGVSGIVVADNNFVGNTVSPVSDSIASGNNKTIVNNRGWNPLAASITVTASPFTWTNNTGSAVATYVTGGTVSAVALDGIAVGAATNGVWVVPSGKALTVTYTVAPTMTYTGVN